MLFIVYVFVWSNLSVQCFVAYEVHCYTLLYTRMHCYLYAHAVILTAYQRSFLSPYGPFWVLAINMGFHGQQFTVWQMKDIRSRQLFLMRMESDGNGGGR